MSGETGKAESGWTVDTLKEYVEQRFIDAEKAVQAALTAAEKAIQTANLADEKRFDSVNEFRNQQKDIISTFLPRTEYDARHETLENRVSELTDRINRSEGKTAGSELTMGKIYAAIAAAVSLLGVIVVVANAAFKP